MNADISDLLNEYRRIREIQNAPIMTEEEVEALEITEGQCYATVRCRYDGVTSDVRVVRQRDGSRTVSVDQTFPHYLFSERIHRLEVAIGRRILEAEDE